MGTIKKLYQDKLVGVSGTEEVYPVTSARAVYGTDGINVENKLNTINDYLDSGYLYAGVADLSTPAPSPTSKVFYIVSEPGTYANFDNLVVNDGEVCIFKYDSEWSKDITGAATVAEVIELGQRVGTNESNITSLQQRVGTNEDDIINLQQAVSDIQPITINGNVTNAPDEEDITANNESHVLKFKDRTTLNGMGYKILRLTDTFANQVTDQNTIYEIRYNFDLDGASVTIPANCVLKFNGGKLSNGSIVLLNTSIMADYCCFDCEVLGTLKNDEVSSIWFCSDPNDFSEAFIKIVNLSNSSFKPINIVHGSYVVDDAVNGVIIKSSVDFNNSTLVCNIENENFEICVSNEVEEEITDSNKIQEILTAINSSNSSSRTLDSFSNCVIDIQSSDNEFQRNLAVGGRLLNPIKKSEYFYVDHEGVILNEFYNLDFDNVTQVMCMPCGSKIYFRNLILEIHSSFIGAQTVEYRSLGLHFECCSNIDVSNISYRRDIRHLEPEYQYKYKYVLFTKCYNVSLKNFDSVNTELLDNDNTSSYVLGVNRCINFNARSINISGGNLNFWGDMGANYLTNAIFENCRLSRIDVHHRANNVIVKDCSIYRYGLTLTGYGTLLVNGCKFYNTGAAVTLRQDYGSYWDGDIIIQNCVFYSNRNVACISCSVVKDFKYGISAGAIERLNAYCGKSITINNVVFYDKTGNHPFRILLTTLEEAQGVTEVPDISNTTYPRINATNIVCHGSFTDYDKTNLLRISYADGYRVDGKTLDVLLNGCFRDFTGAQSSDGGIIVQYISDVDASVYTNTINFNAANINFRLYLRYNNINFKLDNCVIQRFGTGSYSAQIYNSEIRQVSLAPATPSDRTGSIEIYNSSLFSSSSASVIATYEIDADNHKIFRKHEEQGQEPVEYNNIMLYSCVLSYSLAKAVWGVTSAPVPSLYSSENVVPTSKVSNAPIGMMILLNDVPAWWTGTKWVDATGTTV